MFQCLFFGGGGGGGSKVFHFFSSILIQKYVNGVSSCLKEVSMEYQGCFDGICRMFQVSLVSNL